MIPMAVQYPPMCGIVLVALPMIAGPDAWTHYSLFSFSDKIRNPMDKRRCLPTDQQ
jgi:hypothetical protein